MVVAVNGMKRHVESPRRAMVHLAPRPAGVRSTGEMLEDPRDQLDGRRTHRPLRDDAPLTPARSAHIARSTSRLRRLVRLRRSRNAGATLGGIGMLLVRALDEGVEAQTRVSVTGSLAGEVRVAGGVEKETTATGHTD